MKTKRRKLIDKLDTLWSDKVKEGGKCDYCGKNTYLNAHHIFSRSNYSVRWDLDNGICLCSGHHTLNSSFSAHKTPAEFIEWIKEKRGIEWYERLRSKAKSVVKYSNSELEEMIEELELTVKKN
mgnify:CR=1 FL=1|jgi:hypothetical protein